VRPPPPLPRPLRSNSPSRWPRRRLRSRTRCPSDSSRYSSIRQRYLPATHSGEITVQTMGYYQYIKRNKRTRERVNDKPRGNPNSVQCARRIATVRKGPTFLDLSCSLNSSSKFLLTRRRASLRHCIRTYRNNGKKANMVRGISATWCDLCPPECTDEQYKHTHRGYTRTLMDQ